MIARLRQIRVKRTPMRCFAMSYAVGVFLSVEYMKKTDPFYLLVTDPFLFFVFVPAKANLCIVFCNTIMLY